MHLDPPVDEVAKGLGGCLNLIRTLQQVRKREQTVFLRDDRGYSPGNCGGQSDLGTRNGRSGLIGDYAADGGVGALGPRFRKTERREQGCAETTEFHEINLLNRETEKVHMIIVTRESKSMVDFRSNRHGTVALLVA